MILNQVKLIGDDDVFNIRIDGNRITSVSRKALATTPDPIQITFENALAFPGLINSHDHLDFNLFPQLGYKTYSNYVEWGNYIHQNYKEQINQVLKIPVALRVKWGIYKNLISGVTTVVDHGEKHVIDESLITVFDNCQSLHSVKLEKQWKLKLNNPLNQNIPAVIHIGEGTDKAASEEIDELIRWNLMHRDIVGVHGVAMNEQQAKHFKALVWCPETNYFLLNKTAPINKLKRYTNILFGTDSTLTANWDIWDHIRLARKTNLLNDEELYKSLTTNAASIWKLNSGKIAVGKDADIVVVKHRKNADDLASFYDIKTENILLVIHQGNIRLFDETLCNQLESIDKSAYRKIYMNGVCKYVQGDLPGLIKQIHQYCPEAVFPVAIEQYVKAQLPI
jgi:cytosine/adenosine deaminase-related metal-dependent hydrolase